MSEQVIVTQAAGGAGKREMKRQKRPLTYVLFAAGALVVCLFAALMYAIYGFHGVYPGVFSGGVELGRMDYRAAYGALLGGHGYAPDMPGSIELIIADQHYAVDISNADVRYDFDRTVREALDYGRTGGFGARFKTVLAALSGGADIPLYITSDTGLVTDEVRALLKQIARELSQPKYSFDGQTLLFDKGQSGIHVDEGRLTAFLLDKIERADFLPAAFEAQVEEPGLPDLLLIKAEIDRSVVQPGLDLARDPTGGTLIAAQRGIELDLDRARQALEQDGQIVELPLIFTEPKYTDEQYRALLFRDELTSVTTSFNPSLIGRTKNVRLAADFVGTRILNPGDIFSYNEAVGERTVARGFDYGSVYANGTVEDGIGGGICQVSSTLYAAALRADLEIVERKNHSYIVGYVNLGEDATVAWGYIDFRFKNDTDFPIKIVTTHAKSTMTVKLIGTNLNDKTVKLQTRTISTTPYETKTVLDPTLEPGTTKVKNNGFTGHVTETYRVVYLGGVEVSRTFENKSTYRKLDKVVLENPALPTVDPLTPTQPTDPTDPTDPGNSQTSAGGTSTGENGEPGGSAPGGDTGGVPTYDGDPAQKPQP